MQLQCTLVTGSEYPTEDPTNLQNQPTTQRDAVTSLLFFIGKSETGTYCINILPIALIFEYVVRIPHCVIQICKYVIFSV